MLYLDCPQGRGEKMANDDWAGVKPVRVTRGRAGRNSGINYAELATKLLELYDENERQMRHEGANAIGVPIEQFCANIGKPVPNNVNSLKSVMQKQFDKLDIDGRTIVLGYSSVQKGTFKPTNETMILWRAVPVSERQSKREDGEEEE